MRDLLPARKAEPGPLLGASQCLSPSAAPHKVRTTGDRNTPVSDRAPWAPICPQQGLPVLFSTVVPLCRPLRQMLSLLWEPSSYPTGWGWGSGGCHSDPLPWLTASWAPLPALFHPRRGDGRGSPGYPLAFIPPHSSAPAAAAHSI